MRTLAILPRGGLGDVLYHALFARYVNSVLPDVEPVLVAPRYAAFIADLLKVRHVPVCSLLTDASAGLKLYGEAAFFRALFDLRGSCLASFTNDLIDHGLARLFALSSFDKGALGNSLLLFPPSKSVASRNGLNRLLRYRCDSAHSNPKHLVDRQRLALLQTGFSPDLPRVYRQIWSTSVASFTRGPKDSRLVLLFPETAQRAKNLTLQQVEYIVRTLGSGYRVRLFTKHPELYKRLDVEMAGFEDRLDPLRQIHRATAVISADTFSAHLAGLAGTATYVICNLAYRPVWCEYWGAPFANVLNFENGTCYKLDEHFSAFEYHENSLLFQTALQASENFPNVETNSPFSQVLTGSAARS